MLGGLYLPPNSAVSEEAGEDSRDRPGEKQQAVTDADYLPPADNFLLDFRRAETGVEQAAGGQNQQG